ncbi:DivIVA domain-containing protein [Micromonosporaceae bacterium Da 78-11]
MGQLLLFIVVALVVAAIVFGVTVMMSGGDSGLTPVEPDGRAVPLPSDRPLGEDDISRTRFDTTFRGYRMTQVDQALQRAAYDIGYKGELIGVLEAEVAALREGRTADADVLRRAREAAIAPTEPAPADSPLIDLDVTGPPAKPAVEKSAVEKPAVEKRAVEKRAQPAAEEVAGGDDPLAEVGSVPPDAVPDDNAVEDADAVKRR